MVKSVDINADMGESFGVYRMGDDAAMLKIVSSANVACGFHAGDPLVMHDTVSLARAGGVDVGAHPSFLDLWGFGRRPIHGEHPDDLEKMIVYQVGALQAMAKVVGHRVTHVKPHGALSNMSAIDRDLATALARAVRAVDREMIVVALPGSALESAAGRFQLRVAREIYADRAYDDEGQLVSRKLPGAVLHDAEEAARRVLSFVDDGAIRSVTGKRIPVQVDTICVHGDNPSAVAMARRVRELLEEAGIVIRPMSQSLR